MPSTRRNFRHKKTRKNNKSKSRSSDLSSFEQEAVIFFLEMLNTIKLYHWKTHSYATHKATDDLGDRLQGNVDSFIEVLLGKRGDRINLSHVKHIAIKDFNSRNEFKREIESIKSYLVGLDNNPALKTMSNSDLFNIRDEMLGNLNQFLYLLTFK
jgi:hypothetical protein